MPAALSSTPVIPENAENVPPGTPPPENVPETETEVDAVGESGTQVDPHHFPADESMLMHDFAMMGKYEAIKNQCRKDPQKLCAKDLAGNSPLFVALLENEVKRAQKIAKMVVEIIPEEINAVNIAGYNALHLAVRHLTQAGLLIVELLLNAKVNVALCENKYSWTPLHLCAFKGYAPTMRVILNKASSSNNYDPRVLQLCDRNGDTALQLANKRGHHECVSLLQAAASGSVSSQASSVASDTSSDREPQQLQGQDHQTTVRKHKYMDKTLSDTQGSAKISNDLLVALQDKDIKEALRLAQKMVNLKIPFTALALFDVAAASTHEEDLSSIQEIIKLMILNEVDVTRVDKKSQTVFHFCAREGLHQSLKVILQFCNRNVYNILKISDNNGHSALHTAIQAGHLECIRVLQDKGADINQHMTVQPGDTPLTMTCKRLASSNGSEKDKKIIEFLLENGAELNRACNGSDAATPLDILEPQESNELVKPVIEMLLDKGAKRRETTSNPGVVDSGIVTTAKGEPIAVAFSNDDVDSEARSQEKPASDPETEQSS